MVWLNVRPARVCERLQCLRVFLWRLVQTEATELANNDAVPQQNEVRVSRDLSNPGDLSVTSPEIYWQHLALYPEDWWDNRGTRRTLKPRILSIRLLERHCG